MTQHNRHQRVRYNDLYLFFVRELRTGECSSFRLSVENLDGHWTTATDTDCGMLLYRPPLYREWEYRRAPLNSVMFATTGGEGIHYSFLVLGGHWSELSPVVMTNPCRPPRNIVVAADLGEFLRLGLQTGYFALPNYLPDEDGRFADPAIVAPLQAKEPAEWVELEQVALLQRLRDHFQLEPLEGVAERLSQLQQRYQPLIQRPPYVRPGETPEEIDELALARFRPGDAVIWEKGTGKASYPVRGTVIAVTAKRVTIAAEDPDVPGAGVVTRSVNPISLRSQQRGPMGSRTALVLSQWGRRSDGAQEQPIRTNDQNRTTLDALLDAIVSDPDPGLWLVLADWLEEFDDPLRAELIRLHRQLLLTCCEPDKHPGRMEWQRTIVELLAKGVRPCLPQQTLLLRKELKVPMVFNWIPPGAFLMGSPEEGRCENETLHQIELSQGFWLGTCPVTQAQWQHVMGGAQPSETSGSLPATDVSFDDCVDFCHRLWAKTGLRFRLPTDVEWEYACRAGTTTPFFFGETISTQQANYDGNFAYGKGQEGPFRGTTTPVCHFPPNAWGLYDMHGNVSEWSSSCSDDGPPRDQGDDPSHRVTGVLRGGYWWGRPEWCRSAYHISNPCDPWDHAGCRIVLCLV